MNVNKRHSAPLPSNGTPTQTLQQFISSGARDARNALLQHCLPLSQTQNGMPLLLGLRYWQLRSRSLHECEDTPTMTSFHLALPLGFVLAGHHVLRGSGLWHLLLLTDHMHTLFLYYTKPYSTMHTLILPNEKTYFFISQLGSLNEWFRFHECLWVDEQVWVLVERWKLSHLASWYLSIYVISTNVYLSV